MLTISVCVYVPFCNIIGFSTCHVQQKYFTLKTQACCAIQRATLLLMVVLVMAMLEMMEKALIEAIVDAAICRCPGSCCRVVTIIAVACHSHLTLNSNGGRMRSKWRMLGRCITAARGTGWATAGIASMLLMLVLRVMRMMVVVMMMVSWHIQ